MTMFAFWLYQFEFFYFSHVNIPSSGLSIRNIHLMKMNKILLNVRLSLMQFNLCLNHQYIVQNTVKKRQMIQKNWPYRKLKTNKRFNWNREVGQTDEWWMKDHKLRRIWLNLYFSRLDVLVWKSVSYWQIHHFSVFCWMNNIHGKHYFVWKSTSCIDEFFV